MSAYLAARTEYAKAYPRAVADTTRAYVDSVLRDMESRLRSIIGPVSIEGLPFSRVNLDWLPDAEESGQNLDGLLFTARKDSIWQLAKFIVSTPELVAAWVRRRGDSLSEPLARLGTPRMLTYAYDTHSAVEQFADIRQKATLNSDVVFALLGARAQDIGTMTPDELSVGVRRGSLFVLIIAPAAVGISAPPECTGARTAAYSRSEPTQSIGVSDSIEARFHACYDRLVAASPQFFRIVAQVNELAAMVPAR